MASPNVYRPGGSSGARLATRSPLFMSGSIWYVSPTGTDGAGTVGRQRTAPLATIAQAITNASAGDTIQLLGGTFTVSATLAFSKAGLHLYSEGDPNTRARLTITTAAPSVTVTAGGVWMENITFNSPTAAGGSHISALTAPNFEVTNCSFACDGNVTTRSVQLGATSSSSRFVGVNFLSTAILTTARPAVALEIAAAPSDIYLDTVVFDGGTVGWSDYAFKVTSGVPRLIGIDVDFLNDSDLQVATGSIYKFHRRLDGGSARMEFAA